MRIPQGWRPGRRRTRPTEPRRRGRRRASLALVALPLVAGALAACTPTPPAYPYYGPYGSRTGVINEAQRRSDALELYIKDWMDGKASATIPRNLLPEYMGAQISNTFTLQTEAQIDPTKQWGVRPAHPINWNAAQGLFPDPHASYMLIPHVLAPFGSTMTIEGKFPKARYFSVQGVPSFRPEDYRYDPAAGVGEVAWVDSDIIPNTGSTNPYRVGANRNATARDFKLTCTMAIGDPHVLDPNAWSSPTYRESATNNRHCSGMAFRGPFGDPKATDQYADKKGLFTSGQLWLRIYAPDKNGDVWGGMTPPKVTYVLPDGRKYWIHTDLTAFTNWANGKKKLASQAGQAPTATRGPGWGWFKQFDIFRQVYGGIAQGLNHPSSDPAAQRDWVRRLDKGVAGKGEDVPRPMNQEPHATGMVHGNYLTRGMCLEKGKVFTISGTLPTTPKTRNGEATMTGAQARYWSITGYSEGWNIFDPNYVYGAEITSVMDDEIVVNAQNQYILMYGRAADRPSNATAANGITWVEWGPEACQSFTLRWISIGPEWTFNKAIHEGNAGWETDWAASTWDKNKVGANNRNGFLGNYHPVVGYFTKAQVQGFGGVPNPLTLPAY